MSISKLINTWLTDTDRDYFAGVELLCKHSGESFLVRMLRKGSDSYNVEKLLEKLREIAATFSVTQASTSIQQQLPDELVSRQSNINDLMSERRVIKAEMRGLWQAGKHDQEQFRLMSYRILDISDELDKAFGDIQFFKQHGVLAEDEQIENPKELYNLRTYLSKYSKALEEERTLKGKPLTAEKYLEYQERVELLKAQIASIEKELNNEKLTRI